MDFSAHTLGIKCPYNFIVILIIWSRLGEAEPEHEQELYNERKYNLHKTEDSRQTNEMQM